MQIPDVNALIYATDTSARMHAECRSWLSTALGGAEPVGFPWAVLLAFLRLSTKTQIFVRPLSAHEAFGQVEMWLSQPASLVIHPTERHLVTLRSCWPRWEPLET